MWLAACVPAIVVGHVLAVLCLLLGRPWARNVLRKIVRRPSLTFKRQTSKAALPLHNTSVERIAKVFGADVNAVLPTPVTLTWVNVTCSVNTRSGALKRTLHPCSGQMTSGDFTAVIGPSGAGKSTLINVLAHAANNQSISGLKLTGSVTSQPQMTRSLAYVKQEAYFLPTLTAAETVHMYCMLQRPDFSIKSHQEQEQFVLQLLTLMGLQHSADYQVGGALPGGLKVQGLSGGEIKRLHIVCGVASGSPLMFLDEPTTSLDSHAALVVMQHLRGLTRQGQTIMACVHQPPASIWPLFTQVMVLAQGHTMYSGSTSEVLNWFNVKLGLPYMPASHGSVPEWLLSIVSVHLQVDDDEVWYGFPSSEALGKAAEQFALHDMTASKGQIESLMTDTNLTDLSVASATDHLGRATRADLDYVPPKYQALDCKIPWMVQLRVLAWRSWVDSLRNPANMAGRFITFTWIGVIIGLEFLNLSTDVSGVDHRLRCIIDTALVLMMLPFVYISLFVANKTTFVREGSGTLYSPMAYYAAITLAALPTSILNALCLAGTVYGLAGLRHSVSALFKHLVLMVLQHGIAVQVLQLGAYAMPHQDLALMSAIAYLTLAMQLGGVFMLIRNMIPLLRGLSWTVFARYAIQGAYQIEFTGGLWSCDLTSLFAIK